MRKFQDGDILAAIDVGDAFPIVTVMQREVTLVTARDSLGNKTHYSLGRVLPGQRLGSQLWYEDFSTYLRRMSSTFVSVMHTLHCCLVVPVDDVDDVDDGRFKIHR